jgi:hypothetical protein
MIVSPSRGFVFVHLHKAGGTSMEVALEPHLAWNDLLLGSTPFGEAASRHYGPRFGLHKHSSLAEIEKVCGTASVDELYAFALVRHPVDRVRSVYNFVAGILAAWSRRTGIAPDRARAEWEALAPDHPELRWPASRAYLTTEGFGTFIRSPHLGRDLAFRTQLSRLTGTDRRAEAFRLEAASAAVPVLCRRLGVAFDLPHLNRSRGELVARDAVPAEDSAWLKERFREDMDAFGYD